MIVLIFVPVRLDSFVLGLVLRADIVVFRLGQILDHIGLLAELRLILNWVRCRYWVGFDRTTLNRSFWMLLI